MFGRLMRFMLGGLTVLLVGLVVYEAYAVWRAEARTDDVLAEAWSNSNELTFDDLSKEQLDILIAVEDPAFFEHGGIDLSSPGQGMTTITQGLVKRLYFDPFKPGFAKIEQSLIAWLVLDRHVAKEEQLTLFLNLAYFGSRDGADVLGFAAAAQTYFGKPFEELDDKEFTGLVAMLIGPNALMPDRDAANHAERLARIERLLSGVCEPTGVFDPWYENCATAVQ